MRMRYLVGRKDMELAFMEKEIPKPGYNEVLVKVMACGVCGSDLHLLTHSEEFTPLGHEISGQVVEVGKGVTRVKIGEGVIVEDLTGCGVCKNCKNGRSYLCTNMVGLNGQSGMGEYVCVDERLLNLYEGLDFVTAALTEPLAVCVNTYLTAKLPLEGNIIIFGLGPLGIMITALARHYGAGRILCIGSREGTLRNRKREALARAFGADDVYYMSDEHWKEDLGSNHADVIHSIIVTSPPETLRMAMDLADYGTRIVPIGLDMGEHTEALINVDHMIMNKNPILPFIAEPAKGFPLSLDLLRKKVVDAEQIFTHKVAFDEAKRLKEIFVQDREVVKTVITMNN